MTIYILFRRSCLWMGQWRRPEEDTVLKSGGCASWRPKLWEIQRWEKEYCTSWKAGQTGGGGLYTGAKGCTAYAEAGEDTARRVEAASHLGQSSGKYRGEKKNTSWKTGRRAGILKLQGVSINYTLRPGRTQPWRVEAAPHGGQALGNTEVRKRILYILKGRADGGGGAIYWS